MSATVICAKCGAEDSIYETGTVEAWRAITVTFDEEGKPSHEPVGSAQADGAFEVDGFACGECSAGSYRVGLEGFALPAVRFYCPTCDWQGAREEDHTDCDERPRSVFPQTPPPGQLTIEDAAA